VEGADFHICESHCQAGHHALMNSISRYSLEKEGFVGFSRDDIGSTGRAGEEGGSVIGEIQQSGIGAAMTGEAIFLKDGLYLVCEQGFCGATLGLRGCRGTATSEGGGRKKCK
jgi:hypothetical protein